MQHFCKKTKNRLKTSYACIIIYQSGKYPRIPAEKQAAWFRLHHTW